MRSLSFLYHFMESSFNICIEKISPPSPRFSSVWPGEKWWQECRLFSSMKFPTILLKRWYSYSYGTFLLQQYVNIMQSFSYIANKLKLCPTLRDKQRERILETPNFRVSFLSGGACSLPPPLLQFYPIISVLMQVFTPDISCRDEHIKFFLNARFAIPVWRPPPLVFVLLSICLQIIQFSKRHKHTGTYFARKKVD